MRFPHPIEPAGALRLAIAIVAALGAGGCITHQARIVPPAPAGQDAGEPITTVVVVGSAVKRSLDQPVVQEDSLPLDIPVSAWRRGADGLVTRYEGRATTPLPWWQRFPADLVSDALPMSFTCAASAEVVLAPVPTFDAESFLAQARRDGYARPAGDAAGKEPRP
jgi:hypothetical protein